MYVETDFLMGLAKQDDWLQDSVLDALDEYEDIHTSITAYTEFFMLAYDEEAADYTVDIGRVVADLVELVPVQPPEHEEAVLTAAVLAAEQGFTPFDAIHAGVAIVTNESVLTTEQDYDAIELDRVPLDEFGS
ncbi:PIN domain-containing protein [Halonotius roseus]|uniref:PIN domain-containing protein n=1 Tax=Halonotius roseus TaxID=2511997 RepID=A0A544QL09_9EURY|nr:PIN domain-containing protein [Halonotius roseus]TQQ79049.1 PIN domain-containing protein [Halonotius roseus]